MNEIDITPYQHSHSFGQDQKRPGETRTLWVIALTSVMMVVEITTGIAFGSMALLADGIHMASHSVALGISAFAYIYARKHAHDERFSFGAGKVNALGGYTGAILLAMFSLMMAWESFDRIIHPTDIALNSAILVAVIGLLVNGASVFILEGKEHGHRHEHDDHHHHGHDHNNHHHDHGHHHDHNLRSAYLHVLADALTSVTAIIALLSAKYFGWIWMDPLMGIVGSVLVAKWSIGLLKQTSKTLLDHQASPEAVDEIRQTVEKLGVKIADLHVWSIGPGIHSVILSVVSEKVITPETIKELIDEHRFPHITIEVQVAC